ncbi:Hypothetical predicted protein [Pelobates cultripes]|uniref:Uncharacterized protein n=1 Tax=Pelobates cultripes TaxID=61616 RepID=A0AAD1SNL7_PELCU|nr:Hypothetical predicted protein [Pelobates cultripes]
MADCCTATSLTETVIPLRRHTHNLSCYHRRSLRALEPPHSDTGTCMLRDDSQHFYHVPVSKRQYPKRTPGHIRPSKLHPRSVLKE